MGLGAAALAEEHVSLVGRLVRQMSGGLPRSVDNDELVRAASLGLVEAAHRWDPERGVPFEAFALRRMRGAVLDALRAADWAPRSVRALSRRVDEAEGRLAVKLGRTPDDTELAAALGLEPHEVSGLRERVEAAAIVSLDGQASDDRHPADRIWDRTSPTPEERLETREMHGYLRDALELLPERHRMVVVGYFLDGQTSEELAGLLGVTVSRVSQLRNEALTLLRDGINCQFDPAPVEPKGTAAKRRAAYAVAIGERRTWRQRLEDRVGDSVAATSDRVAVSVP